MKIHENCFCMFWLQNVDQHCLLYVLSFYAYILNNALGSLLAHIHSSLALISIMISNDTF